MNENDLIDISGTPRYIAPEILSHLPYDGKKADIFSLGQLLFNLVVGGYAFNEARKEDNLYNYIITGNLPQYWNHIQQHIPNFNISHLSNEFKNLFFQIIAYAPYERPTIDQILCSPWMDELNKLNEQQNNQLEDEVRQEFIKRGIILNQINDQNA